MVIDFDQIFLWDHPDLPRRVDTASTIVAAERKEHRDAKVLYWVMLHPRNDTIWFRVAIYRKEMYPKTISINIYEHHDVTFVRRHSLLVTDATYDPTMERTMQSYLHVNMADSYGTQTIAILDSCQDALHHDRSSKVKGIYVVLFDTVRLKFSCMRFNLPRGLHGRPTIYHRVWNGALSVQDTINLIDGKYVGLDEVLPVMYKEILGPREVDRDHALSELTLEPILFDNGQDGPTEVSVRGLSLGIPTMQGTHGWKSSDKFITAEDPLALGPYFDTIVGDDAFLVFLGYDFWAAWTFNEDDAKWTGVEPPPSDFFRRKAVVPRLVRRETDYREFRGFGVYNRAQGSSKVWNLPRLQIDAETRWSACRNRPTSRLRRM